MSEPYTYHAFGMRILSEFELPWLIRDARAGPDSDRPTVTITRGTLPHEADDIASELPLLYQNRSVGFEVYGSEQRCFWLYDTVGTIRVENGVEMVVSPVENYSTESLRQLIIGPGLRTICVQQGRIVVHASTVVVGSTTVAFAGPSGSGKSTTAAACYARGHDVLTDDLTAVHLQDGHAFVEPGYPVFKLATDTMRELGLDLVSEGAGSWDSRKPADVSDRFTTDTRQLDVIYLIKDDEHLSVEELQPMERAYALLESSFSLYRSSDTSALEAHLLGCGTVASAVRVKRLGRPRSRVSLDELGAFIESDLGYTDACE